MEVLEDTCIGFFMGFHGGSSGSVGGYFCSGSFGGHFRTVGGFRGFFQFCVDQVSRYHLSGSSFYLK